MKRVEEARVIKLAESPAATTGGVSAAPTTGAVLFSSSAAPRPILSADQLPQTSVATSATSITRVVGAPGGVSVYRGRSSSEGGVAITALASLSGTPATHAAPGTTLQIKAPAGSGANAVVTQSISNLKPEPIGKCFYFWKCLKISRLL